MTRILIVEDKSYDRILYKEYLGLNKFHFFELEDGDEVFSFLLKNEVDLILLDWQMPRMNGLETLKMLKNNAKFQDIPVIVITGLENEKVLQESFNHGGLDFIHKPVSQLELHARVNKIIQINKKKVELSSQLAFANSEISHFDESTSVLEKEIKNKKYQLTNLEISTNKINKHLEEIRQKVINADELVKLNKNNEAHLLLRKVNREIEKLKENKTTWQGFDEIYQSIEPEFISKLMDINQKLTPLDIKHCIYIRMNLANHQISDILNIELKSVQMRRYRLRKKLSLCVEQDLLAFLTRL